MENKTFGFKDFVKQNIRKKKITENFRFRDLGGQYIKMTKMKLMLETEIYC